MRHFLPVHFVIWHSPNRCFLGFFIPFFFFFQVHLTEGFLGFFYFLNNFYYGTAGSYSTNNFTASFKSACSTEFNLYQVMGMETGHIILQIIFLAMSGNSVVI